MGKIKATNEISEQVESPVFDLQLPPDIDVKPWAVIQLPRNRQAMIYQVNRYVADKGPVTQWDVYIVSKKRLAVVSDGYNHYRTSQFSDMPALKHFLYDTAATLSIKKRTRKVVDVTDLHEADDDE